MDEELRGGNAVCVDKEVVVVPCCSFAEDKVPTESEYVCTEVYGVACWSCALVTNTEITELIAATKITSIETDAADFHLDVCIRVGNFNAPFNTLMEV